jgi:3-oxoacyl-[acyl-carrier protein] reductase
MAGEGLPGPSFDLSGKVAIVTGASRGIGVAAVQALARYGAAVGINCLPSQEMEHAADRLAAVVASDGGTAVVLPCDVTDSDAVAGMFRDCERQLGPVDVLIGNAADMRAVPWDDVGLDEWADIFAVNSTGTFLCARAAFDSMRPRRSGVIITVSSVTVEQGQGGSVPYIASKGAVVAFTRALARVAGPHGIRVNSVMPGAIRTETTSALEQPGARNAVVAAQCLPRVGVPEDVAGTFVFLASEASAFVTGQVMAVDGGLVHR